MSRANWEELKREYLTDPTLTGNALAKKHNLPAATVYEHIRSEGWARQRKEQEQANTQIAVRQFGADDLTQKIQRVQALQEVVQAWLNSPTKDAKAMDVVNAVKQLEVMMGGVSDRSEKRVIIYEIPEGIFPQAPVFEGSEQEALELDEGNPQEIS